MALGTLALISGIAAGSSALLGAGQMIAGAKKTREADKAAGRALEDLAKIQTTNKLLALQVPTMGAEFQERALARGTAGQVEAMQEAGAAGVIGGAGRLTQAVGEQAGAQAAEINRMQAERDKLVLGQEQAIETAQQDVFRNIEGMRLQGAQAASAQGADMQQAGAQSIASGIGLGAQIFASGLNPYGNQKTTTTDALGQKVAIRPAVTSGLNPYRNQRTTITDISGQAQNFANQYRNLPQSLQEGIGLGVETFGIPGVASAFYPTSFVNNTPIQSTLSSPYQMSSLGGNPVNP
jgi:hypothetical protein